MKARTTDNMADMNHDLKILASSGYRYVFLDEVQEIENWPDICQTLRLEKCSVFISGSNSKLLSSEFTDALSGRYVSFQIHPFVLL